MIKINNYKINPNNIDKYECCEKIKEYHKENIINRYEKINKMIISGRISNDKWSLINATFITKRNKELYIGDHLKGEVIEYYKDLYESNNNRVALNRETFLSKTHAIITIILNDPHIADKKPIKPRRSTAKDYNGFSQKEIEKIIRTDNLKNEIIKFQYLLAKICESDKSSELFIHQISKSILFKKKDNIRGGADIRVIIILPAWLSIT